MIFHSISQNNTANMDIAIKEGTILFILFLYQLKKSELSEPKKSVKPEQKKNKALPAPPLLQMPENQMDNRWPYDYLLPLVWQLFYKSQLPHFCFYYLPYYPYISLSNSAYCTFPEAFFGISSICLTANALTFSPVFSQSRDLIFSS